MGKEENQGKFRGVWRVNGCIFPATSYGENTWEIIAAGEGCVFLGKRTVGIQGAIPSDPKVGRQTSGGMPGQGKNSGKAKRTLYIWTLEFKGGHIAGGTGTVTAV